MERDERGGRSEGRARPLPSTSRARRQSRRWLRMDLAGVVGEARSGCTADSRGCRAAPPPRWPVHLAGRRQLISDPHQRRPAPPRCRRPLPRRRTQNRRGRWTRLWWWWVERCRGRDNVCRLAAYSNWDPCSKTTLVAGHILNAKTIIVCGTEGEQIETETTHPTPDSTVITTTTPRSVTVTCIPGAVLSYSVLYVYTYFCTLY
jgi:hypothetical protein